MIFPRASLHKKSLPNDRVHRDLYVAALRRALNAFEAASVVHLDLRPENVMWGCSCERDMTDEEDPCEIKHDFVFKVIDWEGAFLEGEVLQWVEIASWLHVGWITGWLTP